MCMTKCLNARVKHEQYYSSMLTLTVYLLQTFHMDVRVFPDRLEHTHESCSFRLAAAVTN